MRPALAIGGSCTTGSPDARERRRSVLSCRDLMPRCRRCRLGAGLCLTPVILVALYVIIVEAERQGNR